MRLNEQGRWVMSNWKPCGCTQLERVTGNGCLQCNPERAYDIAQRLVKELEEIRNAKEESIQSP